jgi:hypothetical protein
MTFPRVAVPAYIHPGAYAGDWDAITATDAATVALVVANVADGPGSEHRDDWAGVIGRARRRGITVLGYVDTGYLGRASSPPLDDREADWLGRIRADVDAWYEWYGDDLGGIFLDRAHSGCDAAGVYRHVTGEIERHHPGALTALNPGRPVPSCFENAADVLLTFEGTVDRYGGTGATAGELDWIPADPSRIWHVVYGVPAARLAEVVERGRRRDIGLLYVTDRSGANPWETLTTYWDELTAMLAGPGPGPGPSPRPGSAARRA